MSQLSNSRSGRGRLAFLFFRKEGKKKKKCCFSGSTCRLPMCRGCAGSQARVSQAQGSSPHRSQSPIPVQLRAWLGDDVLGTQP